MSKSKIAILAPLMLIALMSAASAYVYNLSYSCENDCLWETGITWNITLHKGMGSSFEISSVEVVRSSDKASLGKFNDSKIRIYNRETFLIAGKLPAVNGSALNVSPCFTTALELRNTVIDDGFVGMERAYCEKANHTIPAYQCVKTGQCPDSQVCMNNTCIDVKCEGCAYASNHTCAALECCEDTHCDPEQKCRDNACVGTECPEGYRADNHYCEELACAGDEIAKGNECARLQCAGDENAANHTCSKLKCSIYEIARNHTCSRLEFSVELTQMRNVLLDRMNGTAEEKNGEAAIGRIKVSSRNASILEIILLFGIVALTVMIINKAHLKTSDDLTKNEKA